MPTKKPSPRATATKSRAVRATATKPRAVRSPRAAKTTARVKPAPAARALPSLRFHHSPELRQRTLTVLEALESDVDPTRHASALSAVVQELTEAGLAYFFVEPLKAARAGMMVEQAAALGISSAARVLSPAIRSIMAWLDKEPLLVVAAQLRRFME